METRWFMITTILALFARTSDLQALAKHAPPPKSQALAS
jgi:hypothetical protein